MSNIDPTLIILLVLAGLGLISNNMTVTLAILFLLAVRITP
ncbi:membrane protein, partial [Morganella morganii]